MGGFYEQISSPPSIIPLTMLGLFCSPDSVRGTQPSRSQGLLSSDSSLDLLLYVAVGEEAATTGFLVSGDLAAADEATWQTWRDIFDAQSVLPHDVNVSPEHHCCRRSSPSSPSLNNNSAQVSCTPLMLVKYRWALIRPSLRCCFLLVDIVYSFFQKNSLFPRICCIDLSKHLRVIATRSCLLSCRRANKGILHSPESPALSDSPLMKPLHPVFHLILHPPP